MFLWTAVCPLSRQTFLHISPWTPSTLLACVHLSSHWKFPWYSVKDVNTNPLTTYIHAHIPYCLVLLQSFSIALVTILPAINFTHLLILYFLSSFTRKPPVAPFSQVSHEPYRICPIKIVLILGRVNRCLKKNKCEEMINRMVNRMQVYRSNTKENRWK